MSNTYAKIKSSLKIDDSNILGKGYITNMELTLTAFVGGNSGKHTQLTVNTTSTLNSQSGVGYITLGDEEVDLLIAALLERKLKKITATGYEQSIFCPNDEQ